MQTAIDRWVFEMMLRTNRWLYFVILTCIVSLVGCNNSVNSGVAAANSANIKRVGNIYGSYLVHNGWQGPKNEQELKRYLHDNLSQKKLEMMGIDPQNVDKTFISERDGKQFKIRWGLTLMPLSTANVVFEQEGVDGKKQVATNSGETRDVDNAEYQRLWDEKAAEPAPTGAPPPENATNTAAKSQPAK